jgi:hypothetical protein
MPRDRNVRERRREAILQILSQREVVKEQKDLVERLREMGFVATQTPTAGHGDRWTSLPEGIPPPVARPGRGRFAPIPSWTTLNTRPPDCHAARGLL